MRLLWATLILIPAIEVVQYYYISNEQFYKSAFKNWFIVHQVHDVFMYLILLLPWAYIYKISTGKPRGLSALMVALIVLTILWNFINTQTDARFWMFWPMLIITVVIVISVPNS